jgi:hypothetical protein
MIANREHTKPISQIGRVGLPALRYVVLNTFSEFAEWAKTSIVA